MRARFIYEKFTEDSDAIHDMGIGVYAHRNFTTRTEFYYFLKSVIPHILDETEIPIDFINEYENNINMKYFHIIDKYVEKYLSFDGISFSNRSCKLFMYNTPPIKQYFKK